MTAPSRSIRRIMRVANGAHVALYRMSSGRLGGQIAGIQLLLLTTSGRKTGKKYTNPVGYLRDGSDYLVTGSTGGMDFHPAWYLNLKATPDAQIQIGSTRIQVLAEVSQGEERDRLYERFKASSPNFIKYEKATRRVIPVIRLKPQPGPVQA